MVAPKAGRRCWSDIDPASTLFTQINDSIERSSIVVASVGRQVLPASDAETAASFLWLTAIQGIERKQDTADLAPKTCFISAEAVEREAGQIGETQKATREVSARTDGMINRFLPRAGHSFGGVCTCREIPEPGRN